jgi:hypothetical protein
MNDQVDEMMTSQGELDRKEAENFINGFIKRLVNKEIAAFSISYVGFGSGQECHLSGAFCDDVSKQKQLCRLVKDSLDITEAKIETGGVVQ